MVGMVQLQMNSHPNKMLSVSVWWPLRVECGWALHLTWSKKMFCRLQAIIFELNQWSRALYRAAGVTRACDIVIMQQALWGNSNIISLHLIITGFSFNLDRFVIPREQTTYKQNFIAYLFISMGAWVYKITGQLENLWQMWKIKQ